MVNLISAALMIAATVLCKGMQVLIQIIGLCSMHSRGAEMHLVIPSAFPHFLPLPQVEVSTTPRGKVVSHKAVGYLCRSKNLIDLQSKEEYDC